MRILIATACLPWPLNSGGAAAQFSALACLDADHEFTLLCPVFSHRHVEDGAELARRLPRVRVRAIFCGDATPVARPPAWRRGLGRVAAMVRAALRPHAEKISSPEAGALPIYPFCPLPAQFIEAVGEELARRPDLVQCEFAEMLPLGTILPPEIPRLFIHHQLHFVYAERFLAVHGTSAHADYLVRWMRAQEADYLRRFDSVVTFSEIDRVKLAELAPLKRVRTSPFPIPADVSIAREAPANFSGEFFFIGSELHAPNQDALQGLLDDVWPQLRARVAHAKLTVIGPWGEAWRQRAPSVNFTGFVPDLNAVLRDGIMLVPLRIGSGIRTKILAALARGVPVVSTPVGCEGLELRDQQELLVAADAREFAAAAIRLAEDTALRQRVIVAGLSAVEQHYSPERVRERRNAIYAELVPPQSGPASS